MTPFAAVLLAGGQSRRMGRDKALLPLPDGRRLWERQIAVLRELDPAGLYVSGPRREGFPADLVCLADETPGQGPLGGIAAALAAMCSLPLLVVLAVDLPHMTADYLRSLLRAAREGRGVVPRHGNNGYHEPLAAVYPAQCLSLAQARMRAEDRSLQKFIALAPDRLTNVMISADEVVLFRNWNEPGKGASKKLVTR